MVRTLLLALVSPGWLGPVDAVYIKRYTTIANGAMTYTGNTLGLSKYRNRNRPGTSHSIGTFITTDTSSRDGSSWYSGTTPRWQENSSAADLRIPAGSAVLYAELIWGGSYLYGGQDVSAFLNNSVTMLTPAGSYGVSPDPITSNTLTGQYYYVRSADVTLQIQTGGAGRYTVAGVPGTESTSHNTANAAGWTLAVVYRNDALPARNLTVFVGAELTFSQLTTTSSVSGFCTPQTGAIQARMMASIIEGDSNLTGDQMQFGPTVGSLAAVSGPNNPVNNFFCSQVNGDDGTLDTAGTFGTRNHNTGFMTTGGRQGWDITNVDVSGRMLNAQTTAVARGTTSGDRYVIASIGLQIDVGAPSFPTAVMVVDKPVTYVSDILTYTTRLDNTAGTADALNVVFTDDPPQGLSVIPGTVTVDGVPRPLDDPVTGVSLGTIAAGTTVIISYQERVDSIPMSPCVAEYVNDATWTYQYLSCPTFPLNNGAIKTAPPVVTVVPRLQPMKTADPPGKLLPGTTITYRITVLSSGTAPSQGTTLVDPIPPDTTYVPGTTYFNGALVPDVAGQMPFVNAQPINSPGEPAGQINIGEEAVLTFQVTVNDPILDPTGTLINIATIDPDGDGPAPAQQAIVTNPPRESDLAVDIDDGQTEAVAGSPVTYTVVVTHNGPDDVNGFTLVLVLPPEIQNPVYTPEPGRGTYDPATGAWTGLVLAESGTVTLTIAGTVSPAAEGTLEATATVAPPTGIIDEVTDNNSDDDLDTVVKVADLSVDKTNGANNVPPGEPVVYTITVHNAGPSTVTSLTLVDELSADLLNPEFAPDQGVYNEENGVWTGLDLPPEGEVTLTITALLDSGTGLTELVNTVTVTPPVDVTDPNAGNDTATDTDTVGAVALVSVRGTVYDDANHNGTLDADEGGTGIGGLFVKLVPDTGGDAVGSVAVDAVTGDYEFSNVVAGTYSIILDNNDVLTDTVPYRPPRWVGTQAPDQVRTNVTVEENPVTNQDFGLFEGALVRGTVFEDNGSGGGNANDGVKNGAEEGLAGVVVRATDAAGLTLLDTTATEPDGSFVVWIPEFLEGHPVRITETNLGGFLSTGADTGNAVGTYDRAADTILLEWAPGNEHSGLAFGDVRQNGFVSDNQRTVVAGSIVIYPHTFNARTAGEVTFTVDTIASPAIAGWSSLLFRDANCSGLLEQGEPQITGPIAVTADDVVCILVKEFSPAAAPINAQEQITVTAEFTYTNAAPGLTRTYAVVDLTVITLEGDAGLLLSKTVDRVSAKSGDLIGYEVVYRNVSGQILDDVVIHDVTPAFTTFVDATYGPLPPDLQSCAIAAPAAGRAGPISWTFTGTLAPNSIGTVTFRVRVD